MTTWAIGDVHGCYRTLRALLARPEVAAGERYWFVGDLVNRGPRSAETLRFVAGELGGRVTAVLGNHDLHFLARSAGVAERRKRDDLDDLLEAPDRDELASWLRARPLLVAEEGRALVHAGLLGSWDLEEAGRRARGVERALESDPVPYLSSFRPGLPEQAVPEGVEPELLADLRVFTVLRTIGAGGKPAYDYTGTLADLPADRTPWFDVPERASRGTRIFCGHWAALGFLERPDLVALDTGCAWGGALTAYRVEDGRVERMENLDR